MPQAKAIESLDGYANNVYIAYNRHFRFKGTHRLKSKGMEKKVFHTNRNKKKAGIAILSTDKIEFKSTV